MKYETSTSSDLAVLPDVPVVRGPAHPAEYPERPYRSGDGISGLGEDGDAGIQALDYVRGLLPSAQLRILSNEGSTGVVLKDNEGRAFKVLNNALHYGKVEDEVAALTLFHGYGVSPRPHMLIDAAMEHRTEISNRHQGAPKASFGDVTIARQEGPGEYPVIVMESLTALSLAAAPKRAILDTFDNLSAAVMEEEIVLADSELVYDPRKGAVQLIDLGATARYIPDIQRYAYDPADGSYIDMYPNLSDDELKPAMLMRWVVAAFLIEFGKGFLKTPELMNDLLKEDGVPGVRKLISAAIDGKKV